MKDSLRQKLDTVSARYEDIAMLLAQPEIIADQNQFRDLSREYSRLDPAVRNYEKFRAVENDLNTARA